MQSSNRRKPFGWALVGLSLIAVTPVSAQVVERETLEYFANLAPEKIDPALMWDLDSLEANGFIPEGDRVREDLRVVIELRKQTGDATFENSIARDPVAEVTASVRTRQRAWERALAGELDADAFADLTVIDRQTLQYSVVGLIDRRQTLEALASLDSVKYIWKDNLNHLNTNQGRQITGSATAAAGGHTGAGVGVAVIDSSYDIGHPELGGSTSLPNGTVFAGVNFSDPGTSIYSLNFNDCYHGTGTASIVRRYAPECSLYCLTVFPNAYDSVIANSINWCVTNRNGTGGGDPIRVISMSLGGGRYYSAQTSGTMHTACGNARSNGILVFAAAGNDGWSNSMGSPAASTNCISVGSVWDQNGAAYSPFPPANCSDTSRSVNERCCYSDTASFLDIYAPSEQVICARCGGGTFALGGTSSACPAAAGMAAQLLTNNPTYAGDQAATITLMQSTGVQVIGDTSKRRINIQSAINTAGGGNGGGGGGGGGTPALADGVTTNYAVATGGTTAFTIAIPANASNLVVTLTGSGDADLYVKRSAISWPGDQGSHDDAEFKAPYIGGSAESVTFASPGADTWNVLVHGYSGNPSGTITASWDVSSGGGGGGSTPSWKTVSWAQDTPHNYLNNRTYTDTYSYPGASQVAVHFNRLDTETNYDFVRVYDGNGTLRFTVSGNLISGGSGSAFGRTDGWVIVPGDEIRIELVSDYSVRDWGYRTDMAAAYY